jgi:hypothetical protein
VSRGGTKGAQDVSPPACSTGATTARCGGRRETEKIGRFCVIDKSGIAYNGLPPGNDLAPSRFGPAIGVKGPISTASGVSQRGLRGGHSRSSGSAKTDGIAVVGSQDITARVRGIAADEVIATADPALAATIEILVDRI